MVWVYELDGARIHSFMAPFEMFANTTHIIETSTGVVVVDPQLTVSAAGDARAYVDSIGKPIERLIVSHAHPDHYLGVAAAWEDVPVFALQSTIDEILSTGEETRKAREAMFPEGWVADHVTPPARSLQLGAATIGGVDFVFERYIQAEHPEQLVVRLPEYDVTVAQDLVYTVVHPIITDREAIPSWISHVDEMLATGDTAIVLPGHGSPTDASGLTAMKDYLAAAQTQLAKSPDSEAFKSEMTKAFPDRQGPEFLDFSVFFLFPHE
ncbi:MAG: MBL fold metallo-hydrolase [Myxococcota bacterium]